MNLAYIWSFDFLAFSILDLVLLQYLLGAYFKLTGAFRTHRDYFNVIHEINNKYPDADPKDLTEDCRCAICQEKITEGKQLPCRHIFHLKCLQDWMRYRHICPVCRKELTPAREEQANQQRNGWVWNFGWPQWFNIEVGTAVTRHDDFEAQVGQLMEMFPDEDPGQIRADLAQRRSILAVADFYMTRNMNQHNAD